MVAKSLANSDSYFLTGVTSWGEDCGVSGKPWVYANVSYFHDFLSTNMPDLFTCPPHGYVPGQEGKLSSLMHKVLTHACLC